MTLEKAASAPGLHDPARSIAWDRAILPIIAVLAVLMVCYPVVVVALRAVSENEIGSAFTLEWLTAVFESSRSREALVNTAIYTAGSSALAMTLGVGLAFLSTRTDMPGGRSIGFLSLLPMLVPPFILVV